LTSGDNQFDGWVSSTLLNAVLHSSQRHLVPLISMMGQGCNSRSTTVTDTECGGR
jgi:hypothetical protein